ncbi:MAG: hypothetical protein Crog4KO_06480 [Crocinitomicaceae bacterium]
MANAIAQAQDGSKAAFQFEDNKLDTLSQRKALISGKSSNVIQRYSHYADGATIKVKLPHNKTVNWTESVDAEVRWNKGDKMDPNSQGSSRVKNHGWKGLIKNQDNNNNATGLHMVNAKWGGSADANDGNLVPGTPSLNGHHKRIENEVHNLFNNNGGKAPDKLVYKAEAYTPYPQTLDLSKSKSGKEVRYHDPKINCTVKLGTNTVVNKKPVDLGGGTKIVVP